MSVQPRIYQFPLASNQPNRDAFDLAVDSALRVARGLEGADIVARAYTPDASFEIRITQRAPIFASEVSVPLLSQTVIQNDQTRTNRRLTEGDWHRWHELLDLDDERALTEQEQAELRRLSDALRAIEEAEYDEYERHSSGLLRLHEQIISHLSGMAQELSKLG